MPHRHNKLKLEYYYPFTLALTIVPLASSKEINRVYGPEMEKLVIRVHQDWDLTIPKHGFPHCVLKM
ncbi:unnamed protein product [Acanthoscelides obtectus]|uniref:Uncharacterized protein n=1 Tax=Acanthoscelides obtectus TaxID=200917 RepID=A0A9P0LIT2_ACAOB|nr:unnamed protein product [Acanthoscelides obtectus]CAK1651310.1 hypothetical protein AOBTE_LOCUS17172 [Acanthoscelides obtectus]